MSASSRLVASLGPALALAFVASSAAAQPSPLPSQGGPPTGAGGEEEEKPAGIAEAAPSQAGLVATTPAVPPRRDSRKKFQVLQLDGFLRARGDWFKNFNLGFADDVNFGGAPYPQPYSCRATTPISCDDTVKSSNLRLRLEPRIELTNTIAVHSQIDLLDNLVLGSTPDTSVAPPGPFSGGTATPAAGGNASIAVRRAWAEVATALLLVKFGRMPDHFGLGMVANSGRRLDTDYATWETLWMPGAEADVGGINNTAMDLDSDYGDSVDRASVALEVPGVPLRALAAIDWQGAGLQTDRYYGNGGQPADVDDLDDTSQWMIAIARMDAPADFAEKMARGELAYNFAGRLVRRTQDNDYNAALTVTSGNDADKFHARGASMWLPDVWVKVGWKKVLFEAEAAATIGSISNLADYGVDGSTDLRAFGGVARVSTKAFDDKLGYGLEVGLATGDDGEAALAGHTNLSEVPRLPGANDHTISRFVFDPDYHVDLILFRELIGSVSNALYFRPRLSYQLTKAINFKAQNVTSATMKSVSSPGNSTFWGTEFDADLGYSSGGFQAGIAYGVLFPLGAMDHPTNDAGAGGPGFPFGTNQENAGTAGNAHTFQLRLGVEF